MHIPHILLKELAYAYAKLRNLADSLSAPAVVYQGMASSDSKKGEKEISEP